MATRYAKQDEISSILDQALRQHRANNIKRAGELYTEILEHDRYNVNALHLLGLVELHLGNYERAEKYINCAIGLEPKQTVFYINLGIVLQRQKKYSQAETLYKKAIQLNVANDFDLYFNLGLVLAKQGKLREAKLSYERSIELETNNVKSYNNLAGVLLELAEIDAAVNYYNKALSLDPKAYRSANNLGNIYFNYYGNIEKATLFYQKAVVINSNFWEGKFNLANCYRLTNQIQRSILTFQACLKQGNNNILNWYYLGVTYQEIGQIEQAISSYEEAIKISPRFLPAISSLYYAKRAICDWDGIDELEILLTEVSNNQLINSSINSIGEEPFINVIRVDDRLENRKVAMAWSDSIVYKMRGLIKEYDFDPIKEQEKIKIGYIADDFYRTDIAHMLKGLLKSHDRINFEIYIYAYGGGDRNNCMVEVKKYADHFVDLRGLDHVAAADRIYVDGVHVLVDLKGHAKENKFEIMALKPAPIQISYLGALGTTGASFIDYTVLDKVVFQELETNDYVEDIILMPNCFQATDRWQDIAVDHIDKKVFGIAEDQFVFAAANYPEQIDEEFFKVWMNILKTVPKSILILPIEHDKSSANLREVAKKCGISPDKIQFVAKVSKEQHLARLRIVDVVLDTRQSNISSSTIDALWSGVPVITLYGNHLASRASASLLNSIGLTECIANSMEEYEYYAVEYALNPKKLLSLKQQLIANRLKMPLFDTEFFCRNLEKSYKEIWQSYLSGNKPELLDVSKI